MMDQDLGTLVARMLHCFDHAAPGTPPSPPIVNASTYVLPGMPAGDFQYGRFANPTWSHLEDALALLEQAETVVFPTGMAAVAAGIVPHLRAGDRILLPGDGYYTTRLLAERYLRPFGVVVDEIATRAFAAHDLAGYRLVFLESPSNPTLTLAPIRRVAERARAAGALLVVDNTAMTPLGQRPLDLGADAVVTSDTKAMNGHSDVLGGHVASRNADYLAAVREWRTIAGATQGAFEAWLIHRGLKTFELRFDRMCTSAATIAPRLVERGIDVTYPGLPGHPDHALAAEQMLRPGALIGLTFPDAGSAERFIGRARFLVPATSFGGVQSAAERRARWGDDVAPGYVRLSIGCEPTETLWADLSAALAP